MAELQTIHRVEGLSGGVCQTVNRVFIPPTDPLVCPNCGNATPSLFESVSSGATGTGFVCMACTV